MKARLLPDFVREQRFRSSLWPSPPAGGGPWWQNSSGGVGMREGDPALLQGTQEVRRRSAYSSTSPRC